MKILDNDTLLYGYDEFLNYIKNTEYKQKCILNRANYNTYDISVYSNEYLVEIYFKYKPQYGSNTKIFKLSFTNFDGNKILIELCEKLTEYGDVNLLWSKEKETIKFKKNNREKNLENNKFENRMEVQ
ncbi:hypothetical protein [[Mycoplasma] collis]|uniref:hypothetical protein n=1 Tax=[Mycoplasma] collis TaxID=2127 RepID=UPI00051C9ED8|nr:hypothetical protein [[Mycoplasma] collis]